MEAVPVYYLNVCKIKFNRSQLEGDSFHFRVLLQAVFAEFTSNPGLLESAERGPGIQHVIAIHPDCARPHAVRDRVSLFDIAGPYARCQTIHRAVSPADYFVHVLERNHAHHRAKNFFPGDLHVVVNVCEHSRLDEVATISDPLAAACKRGALGFPESI